MAKTLKETVDNYNLSFYTDVAAGQRIGTNYTAGTVTVAATTGVVTGSGTTFTSAMTGRGFKAAGHTKWYRVKHFTSTTQIEIEDDLDDIDSAYTGGAIDAGASFAIEAATAVQVRKATLYTQLVSLKTLLDKSKVPATDRFFVAPADIINLLSVPDSANPVITPVPESYGIVRNGFQGMLAGFEIYSNEQVTGSSTAGYHCLAGHKSAITHALAFTETGIEDLIGDFGKAYKGLNVYGSKVVDERRKALAEGFFSL